MNSGFRLEPDGIYRCLDWSIFPWQQHGFGSSLGNPHVDVTLRQIHSARVVNAHGLSDRATEGDALITTVVGQSIGVKTADCVPILLLDSFTRSVAAIHAGWRGTAASIASNALGALAREFGSLPAHLYAAIGPCIRPCCYEVGPEVAGQFVSFFHEWQGAAGRRTLDLAEANRRQLCRAGVPPDHVFDCGLCTNCSQEPLYSFRRQPEHPGRMIASITRLA